MDLYFDLQADNFLFWNSPPKYLPAPYSEGGWIESLHTPRYAQVPPKLVAKFMAAVGKEESEAMISGHVTDETDEFGVDIPRFRGHPLFEPFRSKWQRKLKVLKLSARESIRERRNPSGDDEALHWGAVCELYIEKTLETVEKKKRSFSRADPDMPIDWDQALPRYAGIRLLRDHSQFPNEFWELAGTTPVMALLDYAHAYCDQGALLTPPPHQSPLKTIGGGREYALIVLSVASAWWKYFIKSNEKKLSSPTAAVKHSKSKSLISQKDSLRNSESIEDGALLEEASDIRSSGSPKIKRSGPTKRGPGRPRTPEWKKSEGRKLLEDWNRMRNSNDRPTFKKFAENRGKGEDPEKLRRDCDSARKRASREREAASDRLDKNHGD